MMSDRGATIHLAQSKVSGKLQRLFWPVSLMDNIKEFSVSDDCMKLMAYQNLNQPKHKIK